MNPLRPAFYQQMSYVNKNNVKWGQNKKKAKKIREKPLSTTAPFSDDHVVICDL